MSRKNKEWLKGIQHMAIAKRITLLYGGIFSLSLLFISGFMMLNISGLQQSEMRRELQETMTQVQEFLQTNTELSDESLRELLGDKYVEVSIYSSEANETYNNFVGEMPPFLFRPEGEPPSRQKPQNGADKPPVIGENELYREGYQINGRRENKSGNVEYILENSTDQQFMLLTNHFETDTDAYRIQVFKMMGNNAYMMRNFLVKMLIVDILGICCAFLIGKYISDRILRPVEAIRSAAERISIEDLSQRISTEGPEDEMKELTITFNSMIDRLDGAFQRQSQFISDASHELRTPIAVIQGYANLINRWGKSDPEVLQESIDSILTETDHMSALIRQLLFLAKGDQNKLHAQKARVSLNEIAAELVREMDLLQKGDQNKLHAQKARVSLNEIAAELVREMDLLQEGRSITFTAEDEVEIFAEYDLIKQLLWIHGENALKYSPNGSEIAVRVWKDASFGYVSVEDHGAGIAEEDLRKIFDRFYRADKSRNKEVSGTGLGLAIARWIIDCHDGEVLVESKVGEGTIFTDKFRLFSAEKKAKSK